MVCMEEQMEGMTSKTVMYHSYRTPTEVSTWNLGRRSSLIPFFFLVDGKEERIFQIPEGRSIETQCK